MVEIAKSLSLDASIIVMDEPTSSLQLQPRRPTELNEVEVLLDLILKLRDRGKAVIYILTVWVKSSASPPDYHPARWQAGGRA